MRPAAGIRQRLFAGLGEMRGRFRTFDWGATPLGDVEDWSQSLRSAASTMLGSAFPNIVLWGPELIQLYNDGYREVMGAKHPGGLGIPTRECWPEAWGFNEPVYSRVRQGETVFFEDVLIPIVRYGKLEDVYFTLSYSPILDDDAAVGGVLITLLETTARVAARRLERERERLLGEVQFERNQLGEVFRQAPGFLAVLRGKDHVFELANDSYLALVGHRDILNKPVSDALPEVRAQGFIELLDRVLTTGEPFRGREVPVTLTHTPGGAPEQRYVDFVYQQLVESDGTVSGVVAHGTDMTEQVLARQQVERLLEESEKSRVELETANQQLEQQQVELEAINQQLQENATELEAQAEELEVQAQELEAQRREAESANRAKSDFLATMSHELRTPLNAIGGYTDLLLAGIRGELTAPQRDDIERLRRSGQHLLSLINDLLNFAKLDAGRVDFDMQPTPIASVVEGLQDIVGPQLAAKSLRFSASGCDVQGTVLVDADKVRQILLNLLTNAVKFTEPAGEITVSCAVDDEWLRIHVRDTGRGIAAENLARVFDPFVQVDRQLTPTSQQGVGLGLAISRDLAKGMGGQLTAESEVGRGSTFTLALRRR